MASYEEIHGKRVETFSSDPTLDSSYEGQVWFNSTSGTLKTVVTSDAFISATPIPTAKSTHHRAGTMTAGLFCAANQNQNEIDMIQDRLSTNKSNQLQIIGLFYCFS